VHAKGGSTRAKVALATLARVAASIAQRRQGDVSNEPATTNSATKLR
jgi:hypothetical protein